MLASSIPPNGSFEPMNRADGAAQFVEQPQTKVYASNICQILKQRSLHLLGLTTRFLLT
jgi:hypothetical protein